MTKWEQLYNLARTAAEGALPSYGAGTTISSSPCPIATKELRAILLETGGVFTIRAKGTPYDCKIAKKSLGCGVYSVWVSISIPATPYPK